MGPLFTPPIISKWDGPRALLYLPAIDGGANWPGGSYDPETQRLYIFSNTIIYPLGIVRTTAKPEEKYLDYIEGIEPPPAGAVPSQPAGAPGGTPLRTSTSGTDLSVQGLPLVKPPYGRITAFDLNKGEIVWQVAHGETPDNIKNHPALKGLNIPRTGRIGRIGTLVTKTLVIAGEGGFFRTPAGQRGAMLRAYDKATGQEVGAVYMPAPQTGSPMTYMVNGIQYITVSVSGAGATGTLMAFKLGK
jgi:quinoprotein glucose dehydrogenase